MTPPPPRPESAARDLPALYISPWRLLRQDLDAVLASLGLKLREIWRRNAAGQFPRPGFWPARLAAGFWPLLLVLGLALPLVLAGLGRHGIGADPDQGTNGLHGEVSANKAAAFGPTDAFASATSARETAAMGHGASPPSAARAQPHLGSLGEEPAQPLLVGDPGAQAGHAVPVDPPSHASGAFASHPSAGLPPVSGAAAPLWEPSGVGREIGASLDEPNLAEQHQDSLAPMDRPVLADGVDGPQDPAGALLVLLREATPGSPPQAATVGDDPTVLRLRVAAGFPHDAPQARRAWADRWLELARQQGYSQLTLEDGEGRLLGRQARAGSGMILLQPYSEPP